MRGIEAASRRARVIGVVNWLGKINNRRKPIPVYKKKKKGICVSIFPTNAQRYRMSVASFEDSQDLLGCPDKES